ncbi:hypothetical protein [uncultured Planococcus sp.]|uniref:hypothetical protein n=1 Tax=uncultured Planococcus sp. TaxID=337815 RepID=UPI0026026436|nr:hypothetical protein [uncultured Planococcus sp.]
MTHDEKLAELGRIAASLIEASINQPHKITPAFVANMLYVEYDRLELSVPTQLTAN